MSKNLPSTTEEKPQLLKAIELILAEPANIKKEALSLKNKYQMKFSTTH